MVVTKTYEFSRTVQIPATYTLAVDKSDPEWATKLELFRRVIERKYPEAKDAIAIIDNKIVVLDPNLEVKLDPEDFKIVEEKSEEIETLGRELDSEPLAVKPAVRPEKVPESVRKMDAPEIFHNRATRALSIRYRKLEEMLKEQTDEERKLIAASLPFQIRRKPALMFSPIPPLVGAICAIIGAVIGASYVLHRWYLNCRLDFEVDVTYKPGLKIKSLKALTVEGKVRVKDVSPLFAPPGSFVIQGGYVTVVAGGQIVGQGNIAQRTGRFTITGPIVFNKGMVDLIININDVSVTIRGLAYTQRDLMAREKLTVEEPEITVVTTIPEHLIIEEDNLVTGFILVDGKKPIEYSPWVNKCELRYVFEGSGKTCSVDTATGKFYLTLRPETPGRKVLIIEASAMQTFAYAGVWIQLGINKTFDLTFEVAPTELRITSIEPKEIKEGMNVIVTVKGYPNAVVTIELDGTSLYGINLDNEGLGTFTIPGARIKAGLHTITVTDRERKEATDTKTITVLSVPAPEVAVPKVYITINAPSATFYDPGVYVATIETRKDSELIPHTVEWSLGDIRHETYTCPGGRSGIKLHFDNLPKDRLVVLSLIITVSAEGVVKTETTTIRLKG